MTLCRLVTRESLTEPQIDQMVALQCAHFRNASRELFCEDLSGKTHALLLEDAGRLYGFSTLRYFPMDHQGRAVSVVYSGDTIVQPDHWSHSKLSQAWIHAVLEIHRRSGGGPLWWFLIVSGFRTYRFLPLFYREFYPTPTEPTPPAAQQLMDHLASEMFAEHYNLKTGIIRFHTAQPLREHLLKIPKKHQKNPHVQFFLEKNSGFSQGDELACLTRIDEENLTPAGRRMVANPPEIIWGQEGVGC
jgi:hypothetical protein